MEDKAVGLEDKAVGLEDKAEGLEDKKTEKQTHLQLQNSEQEI